MNRSGLPSPPEVPVWLELNGEHVWTWMCTPTCLESLACGWLIGEGRIAEAAQIVSLEAAEDGLSVIARTRAAAGTASSAARTLSTGPGNTFSVGRIPWSDPRSIEDLRGLVESGRLREAFQEMFTACPLRAEGGGIHSGALLTDGQIRLVHEDVGRHNVMDKIIGAASLESSPLEGSLILLSGRISGEIAVKGWRSGIGGIATLSIPSSLARSIAERAGLWLIGRSQRGSPIVYPPRGAVNPVTGRP